MIEICSLAPGLAKRLSQIYDELKVCTDEVRRQSLVNERDIKRDMLKRMIDVARPVRRRKADSEEGE